MEDTNTLDYKPEDGTRRVRGWNLGLGFMEAFKAPLTGTVSSRALRMLVLARMTEAGIAPSIEDTDEARRGDLRATTDAVHFLGLRKRKQADEVLVFLTERNADNVMRFLRNPDAFIGGETIVSGDDLIAAVGRRRIVTVAEVEAHGAATKPTSEWARRITSMFEAAKESPDEDQPAETPVATEEVAGA